MPSAPWQPSASPSRCWGILTREHEKQKTHIKFYNQALESTLNLARAKKDQATFKEVTPEQTHINELSGLIKKLDKERFSAIPKMDYPRLLEHFRKLAM